MSKIFLLILVGFAICACTNEPKNKIHDWQIGSNSSISKVIFEQDEAARVKVCSDEYKDIGFSTNINIDYDENTYFRLIEGVCITIKAKKIRVRFATPSSGKRARGTFEILDS
ncbi:MAG: hypothetical protein KJO81_02805 [Gammaproteobacteria bacterium]|nr:hypothetical protein [Gammaproteobacteria bacterium]